MDNIVETGGIPGRSRNSGCESNSPGASGDIPGTATVEAVYVHEVPERTYVDSDGRSGAMRAWRSKRLAGLRKAAAGGENGNVPGL